MNRNLNVSLKQAKELYKSGNRELKTILLNSFTKEELEQSIFDRVYDVESACREIGIDYNSFILSIHHLSTDTIAYEYLKVITKALNEGWVVNYLNTDQKKWFPQFTLSSSGFVFVAAYYGCFSSPGTGYASRLLFKDKETAEYAGRKFLDLYRAYLT